MFSDSPNFDKNKVFAGEYSLFNYRKPFPGANSSTDVTSGTFLDLFQIILISFSAIDYFGFFQKAICTK